ncbi:hypothetical protein RN001_001772 [Aquatica leii]|uniref:RING-type domain-containing protein n=1 Tax=Aquatica leii TaxID=1421715 RepID=A0AAN7PP05_9COLE|nr:hypothetical protein RN001_001772 [Aquatica leii]
MPNVVNKFKLEQQINQSQKISENSYNKNVRFRDELDENEIVWYQFKPKGVWLNDARIKRAIEEFDANSDVGKLLNAVQYSVERIFQSAFSGEEDIENHEEDEEFVLVPLSSDVPQTFSIDNSDSNEEEAAVEDEIPPSNQDEPREAAVCMICQTDAPTTVLLPCKHFGLCDECCLTRQNLNGILASEEDIAYDRAVDHSICPIDRVKVEQYVRVVLT